MFNDIWPLSSHSSENVFYSRLIIVKRFHPQIDFVKPDSKISAKKTSKRFLCSWMINSINAAEKST